jgi:hypothetical protein
MEAQAPVAEVDSFEMFSPMCYVRLANKKVKDLVLRLVQRRSSWTLPVVMSTIPPSSTYAARSTSMLWMSLLL